MTVKVEESCFNVERAFLAKHSNYFRALFESGMRDSNQDTFSLKGGVNARGFLIALAVCNGEFPPLRDPDELLDAVECAAFLQMPHLIDHLCDIVDSDNCVLLYRAASVFGVQELFHSAALFLCDTFEHLRETAEAMLPEDLLQYSRSLSPASYVAIGTHSPSKETLQDSHRVVRYLDEKEGQWRHLTRLPTLCSTSMCGVAVLDNRLYIVGGVYGYGKDTVDGAFRFDPESGVWTALPGPRKPRYDFTLLGHEGRLYAIGGEFQKRYEATAETYDPVKSEWTSIRQAPRPVASAACAVARRRMFVCFWKPPDTTDIYEYVASDDEWKLTTTMIRPQSYGHCMVAHRDNLYVMRNGPCDDFLRCLIDCYNISSAQWTALPGHYINSKGALFTAAIRGDSAFTVKHALTLEYTVGANAWKPRRQMKGFPENGSLWTCLLRLPETGVVDAQGKDKEMPLKGRTERSVDDLLEV
nr:kelch repeat and BTB domain-containing protein 13-like [Nerophis lumbriciformis]